MQTSTFEKLSENKQIKILDASAQVFAQKGYFQAGIIEICQEAEISNGALYKYFENKQGLFISVARRSIELMRMATNRMGEGPLGFWQRIQRILEEVIPFSTLYKDYLIIYMELGSPVMDGFAAKLSDTFEQEAFNFFYKLIKEAQEKGNIREGITPETAAYFLDNHLMLFAFSCVSEHYNRRFHQFFGKGNERLHTNQKIEMIMRSYRQLLG